MFLPHTFLSLSSTPHPEYKAPFPLFSLLRYINPRSKHPFGLLIIGCSCVYIHYVHVDKLLFVFLLFVFLLLTFFVQMLSVSYCDSMDFRMTGFPVLHYLPEIAQTHVHWVVDVIPPSHPLLTPSPPALNLSQYNGFSSVSALHIRWPKPWSFSFSISPSNEYSV